MPRKNLSYWGRDMPSPPLPPAWYPQAYYIPTNGLTPSQHGYPWSPSQPPPLSSSLSQPVLPVTTARDAFNGSFDGNRPPLEEEMEALRYTLSIKERTALFLDEQIEEARCNLDKLSIPYFELKRRFESLESAYLAAKEAHATLSQQRQWMVPAMEHIRAVLHPIRRFPEDLLAFIFLIVANNERQQEKSYGDFIPRYKRRHAAVTLGRVCSGWRRVVLNTPSLWTNVRLNLYRNPRRAIYHKLQHFSSLAQDFPIDVELYNLSPSFFPDRSDSEGDDIENETALLNVDANIRSLSVNFTHYRGLACLPELGTKALRNVKELHLQSEPMSSPSITQFNLPEFLTLAPKLHTLRLSNVNLTNHQQDFSSVRLMELKNLIIHGVSNVGPGMVEFYQLMCLCPHVETVVFLQRDSIPSTLSETTTFPNLHTLTANNTALEGSLRDTFTASWFLAPSLTKLTVIDDSSPLTISSFLSVVRTIRCLDMVGTFDPLAPPLSNFAAVTSEVTELTLTSAHEGFIKLLTRRKEEGVAAYAFPSLLRLELSFDQPVNLEEHEVEGFFHARCWTTEQQGSRFQKRVGTCSLERVAITVYKKAGFDFTNSLKKWMKVDHLEEKTTRYLWTYE